MKLIAFTKWIYDKPIPEMARIVSECGFDGVDLPVREKFGIPSQTAVKILGEAQRIFADHGLAIERLVTDITAPRPDLDELLEAFRAAGVTKIRLGPMPLKPGRDTRAQLDAHRRGLEELEPYLKKHGIHAAIQVHSGNYAHATAGLCLLLLEGRDPSLLGVQVDTGHLMVAGESPQLAFALAGPYLHSVNFKSIRRQPSVDARTAKLAWPIIITPLRDATIDWDSVVQALAESGYRDSISIHAEYRSPYYHYEQNIELTTNLIAEDRRFAAELLCRHGLRHEP